MPVRLRTRLFGYQLVAQVIKDEARVLGVASIEFCDYFTE
jgi:hypothetical protein